MKLNVGDFILVKYPAFGYSSDRIDVGPFIVQVTSIVSPEAINTTHYLSLDTTGLSYSNGTVSIKDVVAKIHSRDVRALFKDTLKFNTRVQPD